jgi:cell division topological specificity factor
MMLELLNRIFTKETGSKEQAKARLKFLLVHDQVDLTPAQIESMKTEIMEVISRYVEVDKSCADFRLQKEAGGVALVSNIPVTRVTARAV